MGIELNRKPTTEEIEEICSAAEEAARRHLLSRVSLKQVSDFDVTVEAEGDKPLLLHVEVALELETGDDDVGPVVSEATDLAFSAAEAKVRELDLCAAKPI
jgi:hypothetical protein